jgi:hypothetical protein
VADLLIALIPSLVLPGLWDGWEVTWEPMPEVGQIFLCPPPKDLERCSECGTCAKPRMWSGLRHPQPEELFDSTREKLGRFGRTVHIPTRVPAWPVIDLYAFRCGDCAHDEIWDMRTDEWWDLEPEDYGPTGSNRPTNEKRMV